ncbi:MAG: 50S ribosomal protein L11 methyltransferase [Holosporales bacterium]|jgi:ribosomal protein L11 methyltransferase|nr:50S ribosomal protein L11 methyltransferase [Holosporales bacterium]
MLSCKFSASSGILDDIDKFSETEELSNISFFENAESGFLDKSDENGFPIAKFFDVEVFVRDLEEAKSLERELKNRFRCNIQNFLIKKLVKQDWIATYTKALKPVCCGRFYFYNESFQNFPSESDLIPIKLNSSLAFGSGHHQTTQGCILNLGHLNEMNLSFQNILDMGCGSGILGICALKLWRESNLVGIDIDPEAIAVANENYVANNILGSLLTSNCIPKSHDKFNLILCNILKKPLIDLCESFCKALKKNGYVIASGIITSQELEVINKYELFGFKLINRIQIEDWLSLLFVKNANSFQ